MWRDERHMKPAVIVVSSHVVRGAVGGRANGFILERMGFPVWSLPTLVLPWHPGHGRATRIGMPPASFAGAVADLANSDALGEVGAIVTGYFGDASEIEPVAELVAMVKARTPDALYLCDPIIGDSDGLFQPPAIAAAIRDRLLPLADIATPNRHELMWLAGTLAADNDALILSAAKLGPLEVIVTSAFAPNGETGALLVTPEEACLARHAEVADAPHGTGDLFAALYLGHSLDGAAPAVALERAAAGTLKAVEAAAQSGTDELPLAACQDDILSTTDGVTVAHLAR
jgi:pyridoxine kinase